MVWRHGEEEHPEEKETLNYHSCCHSFPQSSHGSSKNKWETLGPCFLVESTSYLHPSAKASDIFVFSTYTQTWSIWGTHLVLLGPQKKHQYYMTLAVPQTS